MHNLKQKGFYLIGVRLKAFHHTAQGNTLGLNVINTNAPCKGISRNTEILPLQGV